MKLEIMTTILALMMALPAAAAEPTQIGVSTHVVMKTDRLLLRDVLDPAETDVDFMSDHGGLVVLDEKDDSEVITKTQLYTVLMTAGINLEDLHIRMDRSVNIERGQKLELNEATHKKVVQQIVEKFGIPAQDVKIESAKILPRIEKDANDSVFFKSVRILDVDKLNNSKFIAVTENIDGIEKEHTLFLNLKIETTVAQIKHDAEVDDALIEDDIVYGRKELDTLTGKIFTKKIANGKSYKLNNAILKDNVLMIDDVRESLLVGEGVMVTLTYRSSGLSISTLGMLQTSGEIGQIVRVENIDSQRIVKGRLVSADEVEVAND